MSGPYILIEYNISGDKTIIQVAISSCVSETIK